MGTEAGVWPGVGTLEAGKLIANFKAEKLGKQTQRLQGTLEDRRSCMVSHPWESHVVQSLAVIVSTV